MKILPLSFEYIPDKILIKVDLPAPFEPNKPRHSPSFKLSSTSSKLQLRNVF